MHGADWWTFDHATSVNSLVFSSWKLKSRFRVGSRWIVRPMNGESLKTQSMAGDWWPVFWIGHSIDWQSAPSALNGRQRQRCAWWTTASRLATESFFQFQLVWTLFLFFRESLKKLKCGMFFFFQIDFQYFCEFFKIVLLELNWKKSF